MQQTVLRAFKYALDPTPAQAAALNRHAHAARIAFNYALAAKIAAHEEWKRQVAALVESGVPEKDAREQTNANVRFPAKPDNQKAFNQVRGDSRKGIDGICPWFHEVSTYAFQSAFEDADAAWRNWLASQKGERKGQKVGYPKLKRRYRRRESFRLYGTIRLASYRRLYIPKIKEIRIHGTGKHLARLVERGDAVIQSVTISREGHRWYASILAKVTMDIPDQPTRAQRERGTVGVDLGVKTLAALSKPLDPANPASQLIPNSKPLEAAQRRLLKAQRALSRKQKGSRRWVKAKRRIAKLHHQIAVRRAAAIHQVTKQLATRFATVAIEDLNIRGMTSSAKGTIDNPGRNVRAKAGLNRAILDAAPGEFRRQLEYKTAWYGSRLVVVDRWLPSSKTCSACGTVKEHLRLSDRVFECETCGARLDRDLNAARNIEAAATRVCSLPSPLMEGRR